MLVYFLAIGFAFLFIEIAFIQKFVLFLSHPLYAVAVVLFAFLLFAGIGSAASKHLGMPFPLGLARVEASDARLIAWAWAINGCASVTGAVLATLLAIHVGFTAVVVVALVLYGVAAAARP